MGNRPTLLLLCVGRQRNKDMALKDILVHVELTDQGLRRLDAAIALAASYDAHLIGLYVVSELRMPGYALAFIPEEIGSRHAAAMEAEAERAQAVFEERVHLGGVKGEWRRVSGPPVPTIALHGRYADIVIVGQRDPATESASDDPAMPDQLILSVGRPVLVVPSAGEFPVIGERILVAWDASRLATRAVNDALPLMARAKQVVVLAVNPPGGATAEGGIPSADICLHLARHGIKAEAQHIYAEDVTVGAMLLSRAAEQGIDLIVTGAYGHARWREIVLGGVTRHLLKQMTIPVLMCH
jgi:nucleotide-binding universal stress UspA family protein